MFANIAKPTTAQLSVLLLCYRAIDSVYWKLDIKILTPSPFQRSGPLSMILRTAHRISPSASALPPSTLAIGRSLSNPWSLVM